MRSKKLIAMMLVGIAVMLLYMAFTPRHAANDDDPVRYRATPNEALVDGTGAPRTRIQWASWREPGETPEVEVEVEPRTKTPEDPRLTQLMKNFRGLDVYVEGVTNAR